MIKKLALATIFIFSLTRIYGFIAGVAVNPDVLGVANSIGGWFR